MKLNDYNLIYKEYKLTDEKPDKIYSHLPTVLGLAGNLTDKTVLDLGCGSGFYTKAFMVGGAKEVIGVDNSSEQINLANQNVDQDVSYVQADIFSMKMPSSDIVNAPYVLNYSKNLEELERVILNIFYSLNKDGLMVGIIDLPNGADLSKYGARKTLKSKEDGESITVELFNNGEIICSLNSIYYTKKLIEKLCLKAGFKSFNWKLPVVADSGFEAFGREYWDNYLKETEVGYFVAQK